MEKLQDQFQKKIWANKVILWRRLHSLQLKDGEPVQGHIKAMMELFNELAIVGDVIQDEDCVIYLLASLPDSFSKLVTALEANEEDPKIDSYWKDLAWREEAEEKYWYQCRKGNHH